LDVTHFFPLHPGGEKILVDYLGTDATEVLRDKTIHNHSISAYKLLKKFRVGYIPDMVSKEQILKAQEETKNPADYGIDMSKGLMWQVASLGEDYYDFIETTYIVPDVVSLRYFDSNFLEFFSKGPWYTVPIVWIPMFLYFFNAALVNDVYLFSMPIYIVSGLLLWMFVEYMLHKHVFHMRTSSFLWNCIHFMLHGYHHICPLDTLRLTFPPIPALSLAFIVYKFLTIFFSFGTCMAILSGTAVGYMMYDMGHYIMHHSASLNWFGYFKSMKRHHLYHHYKNEQSNFGISSMLYDQLFDSFDKDYLTGKNRE